MSRVEEEKRAAADALALQQGLAAAAEKLKMSLDLEPQAEKPSEQRPKEHQEPADLSDQQHHMASEVVSWL